jgi:hypothetical protein
VSEFLVKVDKTVRHYGRQISRGLRGAYWQAARLQVERPVFVIGCSRAGTTVVYKTFSESHELGSLQRETHDFWVGLHPLAEKAWATHGLGAADASARDRAIVARYFFQHTGERRFVDKNNQNGLCVPYLHALFPDAHFVYVKRSPGDNIHSLIEGWGKPEEFATWSDELPVKVAVDGGRYTRWCFFLFDGWRDYVARSIEEVCAAQYVAINQAILAARERVPPGQWTEIVYEDLVRDPVEGFRRAFAACGLAFTPALEAHCRTVLDRPYNAFSAIEIDKWRGQGNRARIERVLPATRAVAGAMGYAV